jgi:tripartite-type tricarboxylate transporter receptor subunit TctC
MTAAWPSQVNLNRAARRAGTWCCPMTVLLLVVAGCGGQKPYPSRPILLICPWAVGGGTDRVARQVAMHLEQDLGQPVNVVNAVGGKGVSGHTRGATADADGYTITMMTFELSTFRHLFEGVELSHEDFRPLVLLNQDAAALLVRADAPWRGLEELERAVQERPGEIRASGTAHGGAWHLAVVAWLTSSPRKLRPDDVRWVASRGAAPSLQELTQGGVDLVCCSLPEARLQLASGAVRCLGVMSAERADGFPEVRTCREQGTDVSLVGWRGLGVPKDTPQRVVDRLTESLGRIVRGETHLPGDNVSAATLPAYMANEKFHLVSDSTPQSFAGFLKGSEDELGALLRRGRFAALRQDRFSPMTLPIVLACLLGLSALGIVGRKLCEEVNEPIDVAASTRRPTVPYFLLIVLAAVAFIYAVPIAGFIVTVAAVLCLLLRAFGTRWKASVLVAAGMSLGVYEVFAHLLRVPLPQGWLGW